MSLMERLAERRRAQNVCDRCDQPRDHAPVSHGATPWHAGPDYRQPTGWTGRIEAKELSR